MGGFSIYNVRLRGPAPSHGYKTKHQKRLVANHTTRTNHKVSFSCSKQLLLGGWILYWGRRERIYEGRIYSKQIHQLFNCMDDSARLRINQLGISKTSSSSEIDELVYFVAEAVRKTGEAELDRIDKARKSTSFEDYRVYKKYLSQWLAETVQEHIALLLENAESPDNPDNQTLDQWKDKLAGKWTPLGVRPAKPMPGMSPRAAELHCCQIMLFYGATGSHITNYSQDGGIDVLADYFIGQVKHHEAPVGVKTIRETFGVASQYGKTGIVFAKNGFTDEAIRFATANGVLLVSYGQDIASWTIATNYALLNGFVGKAGDYSSSSLEKDSDRAISWKRLGNGARRDEIK